MDDLIAPCAASTARYTLGSGETVEVPLSLPLGPLASGGRTTVTLPGPPSGGIVAQADLLAEDGTVIWRQYPAAYVLAGGTLEFGISIVTAGS